MPFMSYMIAILEDSLVRSYKENVRVAKRELCFILFYFSIFIFFSIYFLVLDLGLGFSIISQVIVTKCHSHIITCSHDIIKGGRKFYNNIITMYIMYIGLKAYIWLFRVG